MSRRSPSEVQLCSEDRLVLEVRASSRSAPHAEVVRAHERTSLRNFASVRRVARCTSSTLGME